MRKTFLKNNILSQILYLFEKNHQKITIWLNCQNWHNCLQYDRVLKIFTFIFWILPNLAITNDCDLGNITKLKKMKKTLSPTLHNTLLNLQAIELEVLEAKGCKVGFLKIPTLLLISIIISLFASALVIYYWAHGRLMLWRTATDGLTLLLLKCTCSMRVMISSTVH